MRKHLYKWYHLACPKSSNRASEEVFNILPSFIIAKIVFMILSMGICFDEIILQSFNTLLHIFYHLLCLVCIIFLHIYFRLIFYISLAFRHWLFFRSLIKLMKQISDFLVALDCFFDVRLLHCYCFLYSLFFFLFIYRLHFLLWLWGTFFLRLSFCWVTIIRFIIFILINFAFNRFLDLFENILLDLLKFFFNTR